MDWKTLVTENWLLVPFWVNRLLRSGDSDPVREAYTDAATDGLIRAARYYDPARLAPSTGKPVKFSTFASRCIQQSICDLKRRRGKSVTARLLGESDDWSRVPDREPEPAADPDTFEHATRLLQHACLSERERTVLRLHFIDGWSYEQIGQALGMSRQLAYLIRRRGIRKLRETQLVASA